MAGVAAATVFGVELRRRSRPEALEALGALLESDRPRSVYFVHAATANLAYEDPAFRAALNRGDLVLNDGTGVKWAARRAGLVLEDNLVGTDLVPLLLRARRLCVYLLGGRPGVAERAAGFLQEHFPEVEVAGWDPGYWEPSREPAVVERIRRAAPDLLLVGMGNPQQELFIDRHLSRLGCRVAMGVGGLFDHWSGRLRRASPWLRRWGLEWLQLLVQQPHKWRRYVWGNPKFLWRAFAPLRRLAVIALSVLLALVVAEMVVRLIRPQIRERYPEGLYLPSATRQYRLRPGFRGVFRYPEFQTPVRINGQGLRADRDYGPPEAGTRRILAVGDSFTMGYSVAVERTWVRVLESRLGPPWEVLNAGVPGYSTWQELAWLDEEGWAFRPEIVLLGFFLGNDVADNARPELPVEIRDGRLIAADSQAGTLPLALRLGIARHSHLYHLAWPVQRTLLGKPARQTAERYPEAGWEATAVLVDRLARRCAARQARLLVLLIPEKDQVESRDTPGVTAPSQRMRELCRQAGAGFLDLLDTLSGPGLYYPQDGHWTSNGNKTAAHAIYRHLSQRF